MQRLPVICPDTSVHNRMMKDGLESGAVFDALKSRYFVRLMGLSVEELIATPKTATRLSLLASASKLLDGPSDCLYPPHEVMRMLASAYEADPLGFDWLSVDVRAPGYADEVRSRELSSSDEVALAMAQYIDATKKDFKAMWQRVRPEVEPIFQRDHEPRPSKLSEVIPHAVAENGLYWSIAKDFYARAAGTPASDAKIHDFAERCPPFCSAIFAMIMPWYHVTLRDWNGGERFDCGRNDLLMACYLPYADEFISAEKDGAQEKCLAEIARLAGVKTTVRSYDDFCASLTVLPSVA